jgi:hypothetical protein
MKATLSLPFEDLPGLPRASDGNVEPPTTTPAAADKNVLRFISVHFLSSVLATSGAFSPWIEAVYQNAGSGGLKAKVRLTPMDLPEHAGGADADAEFHSAVSQGVGADLGRIRSKSG